MQFSTLHSRLMTAAPGEPEPFGFEAENSLCSLSLVTEAALTDGGAEIRVKREHSFFYCNI